MSTQANNLNLAEMIARHLEWLMVRGDGRTLAFTRDEIDVHADNGRTTLGFVDNKGYVSFRVADHSFVDTEVTVDLLSRFGRDRETIRLVPRESAAELRANIEFARLERANEIAKWFAASQTGNKVIRIALNQENGRLGQIIVEDGRTKLGLLADVTSTLTHESMLASAVRWRDELAARRKDPISTVGIIAEKRQARETRKLHALLNEGARRNIRLFEIDRRPATPIATEIRPLKMSELWRAKAKPIRIPDEAEPSDSAQKLIGMAPDSIDRIFSRNGETLRFRGLPFARVRRAMGRERAWFGIGRNRVPISEPTKRAFRELRDELERYRSPDPPSRRHELFRLASEAWLEAILKRDITKLDANLILSPIYNQFRTSNDRVDLLAVRRDGRLVIIEIKTSPDAAGVYQAMDYWRKIEHQRRRGVLNEARLFGERDIMDKPALVYSVAPALSFHRDFEYFARTLHSEIELWRFELHEDWRREIKVIGRRRYA